MLKMPAACSLTVCHSLKTAVRIMSACWRMQSMHGAAALILPSHHAGTWDTGIRPGVHLAGCFAGRALP